MRWIAWFVTAIVVAALMFSLVPKISANGTPTAVPTNSTSTCPITKPNGIHPPESAPNNGDFGNDALWTNLSMWSESPGIVPGSVKGMKWAWYRFASGELTIEGRRLDAPADPLIAWIPSGYGNTGFQVSGLTFPSAGCWEITGTVDDVDLTFVVLVVMPSTWDGIATPEASLQIVPGSDR